MVGASTAMRARMTKLICISGSLRAGSFNTAILKTITEKNADKASFEIFPLNDVPLYNADHDGDASPEIVRRFRDTVAKADGIIISSPEYNHGISGVLKNALDWLSRPPGKSVLTGKPVLLMTASSGAVGGARAYAQMNEALSSIAARALLRPQILVAKAGDKIRDGKLADAESLAHVLAGVDDLLKEIASPGAICKQG
jgi:chromate reductase